MSADPIRILHIEDSVFDRELVGHALSQAGNEFAVSTANNRAQFEAAIQSGSFDCVLTDFNILGFTGIEVIDAVRAIQPHLPVVILTGTGSEEMAVEAMKRGAADYILKSNKHIGHLPATLRQAVEKAKLETAFARRQAQADLASKVFEISGEGILITDADGIILAANPYFCEMTGYQSEEIVGQTPRLFRSGMHDEPFYRNMWESLRIAGAWHGEITNHRKDGTLIAGWLSISAVRDATGSITHYVSMFTDAPERRALDERLQHLTQYDALTDLPNRMLLMDRLDQAFANADRFGRSVALVMVDLVRFHNINDALGHRVGDAVLLETARRLTGVVRPGDTVARIGADEFALLLANLDQESDVIMLVQRIFAHLAQPMEVEGHLVPMEAYIGIALYPKNGRGADLIFKAAGIALDRSRQAGSGSFRFYAEEMDLDAARRLRLESELRQALEREELHLHYQPQINLVNGRICGYEALLRWMHPELGRIAPDEFIPVAEESGLIDKIGIWVIREACRQNRAWIDAGFPQLPVAVNVSAHQFRNTDLIGIVRDALDASRLPGDALELEITESVFLNDIDRVVEVLRQIKQFGVHLALDDFGTGYSSLSHLSRLPFDKIKIDQGFVRDIVSNPINAAIVNATIAMGRSLNMMVLAEGVENEAQLEFLRKHQSEAIQGWLFSRALPADELARLLADGTMLEVGAGGTAPVRDTLLLLDDEQNVLNALKRLLRREGYEILATTSPDEAFALLAQNRVQVVVSDQRMPDMSGTEFLARVKQIYPDTVRIVLSGFTDLESLAGAVNRGSIYRYLSKPWNDDDLRCEIREAFRVAHGSAHK
jgi:diguanylate cyclase (GGDEF)-like protein/PAS domain S-box-containing protein